VFVPGCGVTLALPLSNGVEDVGVALRRASVDGGGCGDAGDGDRSLCERRTSAALPDCGEDFGSGGTENLEEYEWFPFTSAIERESGERRRGEPRRGGGVGECRRRSREGERRRGDHDLSSRL